MVSGREGMTLGGKAFDLVHLEAQACQRIFDRPRDTPRGQTAAWRAATRHALEGVRRPDVWVAFRIEAMQ